ncbi:hypothetical protein RB200_05545 [Streptomyces sp. PmtG]
MSLSSCLGYAGDWQAALRQTRKALREWDGRSPGTHHEALADGVELRVQRGWVRWHLGDLDRAVRDTERATAELRALDPQDRTRLARARAVRALIHLERGEAAEAREAAEEAVRLWEVARAGNPALESMPYIGCLLIRAAAAPERTAADRALAAELTEGRTTSRSIRRPRRCAGHCGTDDRLRRRGVRASYAADSGAVRGPFAPVRAGGLAEIYVAI